MNQSKEIIMRLIKLRDIMACTGLGRSTLYKHMSEGLFPKPVSLGERAVAWVESEIEWIMDKIEQRDIS